MTNTKLKQKKDNRAMLVYTDSQGQQRAIAVSQITHIGPYLRTGFKDQPENIKSYIVVKDESSATYAQEDVVTLVNRVNRDDLNN